MISNDSISIFLQFVFATVLPTIVGVILIKAEKLPFASRLGYWQKQVIIGILYGLVAIYGTEFGIKTDDATMNVRDAAPIVAGLYFGSPAGIIAGLIGGIERWFAALWGRGMFTRVACSVATATAGFYVAGLNRVMFQDRKPSWPLALFIGVVAEVLHLLLVFPTNLNDGMHAFVVVQACTMPMLVCNGIGVALAGAVFALMKGEPLIRVNDTPDISQVIQARMLGVVVVGFVTTVGFTFGLQTSTSYSDTINTLTTELDDAKNDIHRASDEHLLSLTSKATEMIPAVDEATDEKIKQILKVLNVSDVHVVDGNGIIVASSNPDYVGFDMSSGEQAAAFLDLLPKGRSSYYVQDYQPISYDQNVWRKFAAVRIKGGFLQLGYDSEKFHDDIADQVNNSVANRHVGREGLITVLEDNGVVVGSRTDVAISNIDAAKILDKATEVEPSTLFSVSMHGEAYQAMREDVEGFCAVAMIPQSEVNTNRDLAVLTTSFMEVLVFAALFVAIYLLIKNVVVSSIWQVNDTLNQITSGDLEAKVDVRGSTEFSTLSSDINRTVDALRKAIAAESRRIENDLATAKAIQESALPCIFPPFPDIDAFDIYASMNAAREVGGDFYDFFLVDDHTLGFLIADVSGKGIPASLFMMAAKSELANYITSGMNLDEAVGCANKNLCKGNDAGMFVTVWAATLDWTTGRLTYVNAGHNPPLLRHDGEWQWLKQRSGLFLGTFDTAQYRQSSITLARGDELFLYTDGVNEAFSVEGEEFGNERLEAFLSEHAKMHPHLLVSSVREHLRKWSKGAEQSDDITMLCLEYGVPPAVSFSITVDATRDGLVELIRRMHFEFSQLRCPEHVQQQIDLTVEELFTNICQHGYGSLDAQDDQQVGQIQLDLLYNANPDAIVASVTDWGPEFDPLSYDRDEDRRMKMDDDVAGMGIMLALKDMDDFAYLRDGERNVVAFRKEW